MLYEKRDKMPPNLAEIPYGFKNLWRISVSGYSLQSQSFAASDITAVILNGEPVSPAQLKQLFDYNRDICSLVQSGSSNGLFVTLTDYAAAADSYNFQTLVVQELEIPGVFGVSGDMVDNTDPLRPVILHDAQKLDVVQYDGDRAALGARLTADEASIQVNAANIEELQNNALTGVEVNGELVPVSGNTAHVSMAVVTPEELGSALAAKVDKTVAGTGERVVQNIAGTFNTNNRTLSFAKTMLSLEDGSKQTATENYALAELLGIANLEAIDKELFYFCPDSVISSFAGNVSVALSSLYRNNADGTTFRPAKTDNIRLVFAVSSNYSGYGQISRDYISAVGRVVSATAATLTCAFINLQQFAVYNKYNGYRAGTIVYDSEMRSTFAVIQAVPRPTTESNTIPLTNALYYAPIRDYSIMEPGTVWANFETSENAGEAYPTSHARLKLLELGSGYNDYVEFIQPTIPAQILTDTNWNANISEWVTDGLRFTSRAGLIEYLSNFGMAERFKISNRGIIATHYEDGGITITPLFTNDSIKAALSSAYQPIPLAPANGNVAVYDSSNILIDSGKKPSDFATAAQGAKADTAVQTVALSSGAANGTVKITVNGNEQSAPVTGLGSAAYTASSAYATAAQGAKADTALQTASLEAGPENGTLQLKTNGTAQSAVAIPGLGSAAFAAASSFATSAQGTKADTAVQTISIAPGETPGTIKYSTNGGAASPVAVAGLGSAAYAPASSFATATQGSKADTALQPSDVVNNLSSTDVAKPLSANQGRILEQLIQSMSPAGRPIGGFMTFADAYGNTSQYAPDLLPINVNDTIYIAADENHTDEPAQYRVSAIDSEGDITYSFVRLLPDAARDFMLSPVQPNEIALGAIISAHIQNGAVITEDIADEAVTPQKLSDEVRDSMAKADSSLQTGITTSGTGAVVSSVTQNAGNSLTVSYTNDILNLEISGAGDYITGAERNGLTLTLLKDGTALSGLNFSGEGNAIVGATATGNTLTLNRGAMLSAISTDGTGNVLVGISPEGVATKGTALVSISKAGSGNVLTGVSVSDGAVELTSGTAVTSVSTEGTGNVVGSISTSGGAMTVTKTSAITSLPDASTSQKGIVQLSNALNDASTDRALTSAQGKALADSIANNDALYVKLAGNQTIAGTKTLESDWIAPSKATLPATPSATKYATEAQTATRVARPVSATPGNIAIFDASRNIVDSGVSPSSIEIAPIDENDIDVIFNSIFS